ncbi:MAG: sugar ABC transporter permease [Clostridia bacterium]|nr:sugar ABC transporter permease [Clostridia bacterium]
MARLSSKTESNKPRMSKKAKDYVFVAAMLFIPVVHFIIFWGVVNFNSILLAFQRLDMETGRHFLTLKNFEDVFTLFKTDELKIALVNTLLTSGFQIVFLLPWGFFLTYFLYKKIPLTGVWRVCLFLPTILPAIFMTSAFKYAIYPQGPIGKIWEFIFNKQIPTFFLEEKWGKWAVLAYFFWTNFGGQFILFTGAMTRIPDQLLEAAQIDGAGMWVELFTIVFPLCWSTFSMLLVLNIASIFTASGPILLLTKGAANTETISYWIFRQVNDGQSLYLPSALGLICTIIIFPIVSMVRTVCGKIYADVEF